MNQAAMLQTVESRHGYGTRATRAVALAVTSRDHRSVGSRVPREWGSMGPELRQMPTLAGFKRASKAGFLGTYS